MMITKICHIIADFFIKEKIISEEQRDVYEYGLELCVSTLIGVIITVVKVDERTISFNPASSSTYNGSCTFSSLSANTNYFIEFYNATDYGGLFGPSASDVGVGCNELVITRS